GALVQQLPFYLDSLLCIHYFPRSITNHHNHFREADRIERILFVTVGENFYGKYILHSGHGTSRRIVDGFHRHAKRRKDRHGNQHAFGLVVKREQRLTSYYLLTI